MSDFLEESRAEIDDINRQIVQLLARRREIVDELCEEKAKNGQSVRDKDREKELLNEVGKAAEEAGMADSMVRDVFRKILNHSVARQRQRRAKIEEGPEY